MRPTLLGASDTRNYERNQSNKVCKLRMRTRMTSTIEAKDRPDSQGKCEKVRRKSTTQPDGKVHLPKLLFYMLSVYKKCGK